MQVANVTPNTPEWLALREQHFCASDAATAMGVGKYKTREQFLREKVSGIAPDVSPSKQRLFDGGHAAEKAARPLVEKILGEDLYPCVVTRVVDGLPLLASLDGHVMDETIIWESKQYNADLARDVEAGELDPHYWAQLEHQLLVSEAEKVYFTTTDGTPERMVGMWYVSIPERRAKVIAAWKQFAEDMANYKHVEHAPEAEKPVIEQLPALQLRIDGDVTVQSNLPAFMDLVMTRVRAIKTDLVTDEDFARAKATVVFLKDGEDKVKMAMDLFLNQSASIADVKTKVEALLAGMRAKRLALDKSVTAQESSIRIKILGQYKAAWDKHLMGLRESLSQRVDLMPAIPVDFALAMKNKRLLSAIHDSCEQALANAKLAAGDVYARIQTNMAMMREHAANHGFLFQAPADLKAIVNMGAMEAEAVVKQRISEYEAAEQKKRDDAAAAQARREEEERQRQADIERRNAETQTLQAIAPSAPPQAQPEPEEKPTIFQEVAASPSHQATRAADAQVAVAPASASEPTMNLGKISTILGFNVTAAFLVQIGCHPAKTERASVLYHDKQILDILESLDAHLTAVYTAQKAKYQPARTRTPA